MNWKTWLIIISAVIYAIWYIFLSYTVIKETERKRYEPNIVTYKPLPIPVWLIIVSILSLIVPILNVLASIGLPFVYLGCIVGEEDLELKAKDDVLCTILKGIWKFLSKSLN